jgi:hypothetical protein
VGPLGPAGLANPLYLTPEGASSPQDPRGFRSNQAWSPGVFPRDLEKEAQDLPPPPTSTHLPETTAHAGNVALRHVAKAAIVGFYCDV